jgi:hypothetical protein
MSGIGFGLVQEAIQRRWPPGFWAAGMDGTPPPVAVATVGAFFGNAFGEGCGVPSFSIGCCVSVRGPSSICRWPHYRGV